MKLTVKELKKKLRGLPDNMNVYISDHDHAEWETSSSAGCVDVVDQKELKEEGYEIDDCWKIKGKYLVIRP